MVYPLNRPETDLVLNKLVSASFNNVKKLNSLIGELLNANSIGLGKLNIKKDSFDLIELIRESTAYLSTEAYPIKLTGETLLKVWADEGKIEQVIVNLVNNAHKYAGESDLVEINVTEVEDSIKVSVIDRGEGIPEEKLKFLFDRYYQVENKGGKYSGMGLGLYICAGIIHGHNGQIGVESQVNKGSTFWFSLPKAV